MRKKIINQSPLSKQSPFSIFHASRKKANGKSPVKGKRRIDNGFTIIELMVATTIFSIVLMVILASFLQIGRMFYKGISINNTNEATRTLVDDITSDIKLSQAITTPQQYTSS